MTTNHRRPSRLPSPGRPIRRSLNARLDITRPQLILDDTVIDIAGSRGGQNPRQTAAADGGTAPADADSPPTGKPGKKSRSVFGPEPASRPDVLTNADTVVMPSLKGQKGSLAGPSAKADEAAANARNAAAVKQPATTTMVPVGTNAAFAEAATQILPTVEPSQLAPAPDRAPPGKARVKRDRQPAEPPSRYTPGRRTTMISRLILLAILSLQAVLSLRLRNTAFEDESLYLYAGHMELQHLLHGAALQGQYSVVLLRFPGAVPGAGRGPGPGRRPGPGPGAQPGRDAGHHDAAVRADPAAVQRAGRAVRGGAVRGHRSRRCSWGTSPPTTPPACSCSPWPPGSWYARPGSAGRCSCSPRCPPRWRSGVKYAGLLFVPTIAVLPVLAGWPERGRRVLWYPAAFAAAVAGLLYGALRLGGQRLHERHLVHDHQPRPGRHPG